MSSFQIFNNEQDYVNLLVFDAIAALNLSQFTTVGGPDAKYATVAQAVAANKTNIVVVANTTEVTNFNLSNNNSYIIWIKNNVVWDLSTFIITTNGSNVNIIGSGGAFGSGGTFSLGDTGGFNAFTTTFSSLVLRDITLIKNAGNNRLINGEIQMYNVNVENIGGVGWVLFDSQTNTGRVEACSFSGAVQYGNGGNGLFEQSLGSSLVVTNCIFFFENSPADFIFILSDSLLSSFTMTNCSFFIGNGNVVLDVAGKNNIVENITSTNAVGTGGIVVTTANGTSVSTFTSMSIKTINSVGVSTNIVLNNCVLNDGVVLGDWTRSTVQNCTFLGTVDVPANAQIKFIGNSVVGAMTLLNVNPSIITNNIFDAGIPAAGPSGTDVIANNI